LLDYTIPQMLIPPPRRCPRMGKSARDNDEEVPEMRFIF
jgi:hypothetical protein